ncbi:33 kDa chaperonin [Formosimonas limnophila]|uniref:33 kDa chaperonin n=1 Tax=Formosimonas limnophila TaxID=1384487 RepID=A0A8J3CLF4_9BURK|nr:Hsp33 family molecular chaperone HslO [Formosimonas limnophila]GHA65424.1 33 kDa chaperonin [Formosimonas limnophila]
MSDTLHRFLFKDAPVKGELVHLPKTWRDVRAYRRYPAAVEKIMGELVAASALLCANLKFDGSLVMQIHGDGPIILLVAECRADLTVRATAKLRENAVITDDMTLAQLINTNGQGRFAITLDPNNRQEGQQPYQGIVPLTGESMADILMHYMTSSEQLDTVIQLSADDDNAAGFLLQRLPDHGGGMNTEFASTWDDIAHIGRTLGADELLKNDTDTLMHRLFWEQPRDTHTTEPVQFACTCSPTKVANMITLLGEDEATDMLDDNLEVNVSCDFCGQHYMLSAAQVHELFTPEANAHLNSKLH